MATTCAALVNEGERHRRAAAELASATDDVRRAGEQVAEEGVRAVLDEPTRELRRQVGRARDTRAAPGADGGGSTGREASALAARAKEADAWFFRGPNSVRAGLVDAGQAEQAAAVARQMSRDLSDARVQTELAAVVGSTPVGVTIVDLADGRTLLEVDGDRSFTSASTYKLIVASSVIDEVEAGRAHWDDPLEGRTLRGCLEQTIVVSDNDCPVAWLDVYGYRQMEEYAHRIGATHTSFTPAQFTTTSADMARVLVGLHDGELMTDQGADLLLSLMRRQIFREGLGTLEPQATVADKVGWLDDVHHDVGIVSTDHGDFVFSILTEATDWGLVADIARTVDDWLPTRPLSGSSSSS